MNIDETKAAIKIMQAYVDGAEIETSSTDFMGWESVAPYQPMWNWYNHDYRVALKKPVTTDPKIEELKDQLAILKLTLHYIQLQTNVGHIHDTASAALAKYKGEK